MLQRIFTENSVWPRYRGEVALKKDLTKNDVFLPKSQLELKDNKTDFQKHRFQLTERHKLPSSSIIHLIFKKEGIYTSSGNSYRSKLNAES